MPVNLPDSPESSPNAGKKRRSPGRTAAFVILLLLSLPAAAIAALSVCFVTAATMNLNLLDNTAGPFMVTVCSLLGLVVFGLMIWAAIAVRRRA